MKQDVLVTTLCICEDCGKDTDCVRITIGQDVLPICLECLKEEKWNVK